MKPNTPIAVTGAYGFIGSRIVRALNQQGYTNIIAVDDFDGLERKFKNLLGTTVQDVLTPNIFLNLIDNDHYNDSGLVILHQGACANTGVSDAAYMMQKNYEYTMDLLTSSVDRSYRVVYASSGAVYGKNAINDDRSSYCEPVNIYGYSKYLVDQLVQQRPDWPVVGLRYFNVYGPGESHKGSMASIVYQLFNQYMELGYVTLFKGSDGYDDGEQIRDFVHVDDIVRVNVHFMNNDNKNGIYNVGTGIETTFNTIAVRVINAVRRCHNESELSLDAMRGLNLIRYRDMPENLQPHYQSYTRAFVSRLQLDGRYVDPFTSVANGINSYVEYLYQEKNGKK